jgi:Cu2+-exporting ATPase
LIQQGVTGLGEWLTTLDQQASSQPSIAQPSIYVAVDGRFMGELRYTDPLRPESAALVQTLQTELGLDVRLLTGDTPARAAQVARALEIPTDRVYAEAFPDRKATIIRDLRRSGRTVAFVGDGLNDSVALAYADVSISFEQGSEIARETADVVLMNNHLLDLLEVLTIARQTQGLIEQNTALVVLPNLIALGLATTRGLSPPIATAIHNGSAIAAGLNSLRPLIQHHFFERPRDR